MLHFCVNAPKSIHFRASNEHWTPMNEKGEKVRSKEDEEALDRKIAEIRKKNELIARRKEVCCVRCFSLINGKYCNDRDYSAFQVHSNTSSRLKSLQEGEA